MLVGKVVCGTPVVINTKTNKMLPLQVLAHMKFIPEDLKNAAKEAK